VQGRARNWPQRRSGFNGGSALAANGVAAQAFVNTDIAGSIAMCT
jgi:Amt family ammonium transporter